MVRFLTLLFGSFAAVLLFVAAASFSEAFVGTFFGILAGVSIAVGYSFLSFNYVPIGHKGVPLYFGSRLLVPDGNGRMRARFEIPEGLIWLPWPFLGLEDVDVREQTINVTEFTVISQNAVRVTVRPSVIRFRIDNPGQSLSVGMSTIRTGASELQQNIIRSEINAMSDERARQATDQMRDRVKEEADRRADDWGVKMAEILIGEVALPESVQRDYERVVREERQMVAETVELNHVAARIREMTTTLTAVGGVALPAERAAQMAVEIVQRERGKAAIAEQRIALSPETLEALGPFVKTLVGRQRKKREEQEDED